jgi:hypothetical protein
MADLGEYKAVYPQTVMGESILVWSNWWHIWPCTDAIGGGPQIINGGLIRV